MALSSQCDSNSINPSTDEEEEESSSAQQNAVPSTLSFDTIIESYMIAVSKAADFCREYFAYLRERERERERETINRTRRCKRRIMGRGRAEGSVSWDEFRLAARVFMERWNRFNSDVPQFSWVPCRNPPWLAPAPVTQSEGYLSVDNVVVFRSAKESCNEEGVDNVEEEGEEEEEELSCSDADGFDDPAAFVDQNHELLSNHYDFHVIYNASYRVPVLYFRSYCSDGQTLGLDDIVKNIPPSTEKLLKESKWTFITQEDHPYLNRPWYMLHPCATSEWMKMLYRSDAEGGISMEKYLISWFSVVGQVFGLKISFEMLA